ncbi:MAG TPA: M1 family metallopeptidase [Chitinophagaceae bacterium]|nr:M1 family metallopeptidase [Chitinophagaceae bacterium]
MKLLVLYFITLFFTNSFAQPLHRMHTFTHQDSLRGTLNAERSWWNVLKYDIEVRPDYITKRITGKNIITYFDNGGYTLQLDLQRPMNIDSIISAGGKLKYTREGNAFHVAIRDSAKRYKIKPGPRSLTAYFSGVPREAVNPPWDGGWIFSKDSLGRPWMTVACQGLGASVWYPCKDHQSDEPDSASLTIVVPDSLVAVGNGRMAQKKQYEDGTTSYTWVVKNPINNYNIVPYIGKYVNFSEVYKGEKGKLDVNYWVLDYNLERAKQYMPPQVTKTLSCFEHWFGPYPFYEDGYKIVEAPHLGMEHQSAIAYGNNYEAGYAGMDWSKTGWGLKWDFIIVHETGHEWFGNNITAKDIADMWIHESFTNYSETLFTECRYGKKAGDEYVKGTRQNIKNDTPIIGPYGVNQEGSGDMYWKGANMLHLIRQKINNDEKFRSILRGLNKDFYHQTVTTKQIENYISKRSGIDFSEVFDWYLRTTKAPSPPQRTSGDNNLRSDH